MPKFDPQDPIIVNGGVNGNLAKFGALSQLIDSAISAAKVDQASKSNDFSTISAAGAVPISGYCAIANGTGIAGLTLAAPQPGCRCTPYIVSTTSGASVITCAAGVTVGTTTAATTTILTLTEVADSVVLVYGAANKWLIVENTGAVSLS